MSEWVLVDTISQYRMRYLVEVPDDHPEYALDIVTMSEAKEFSQEWLGETIFSHRIVSEREALQIFDKDNYYLKNLIDEKKKETGFTTLHETQNHSEHYYDIGRNR